jgi:ABC-type multidrug transport system ATPase subunit
MDLPTSGLDSATALDLVEKTKAAARGGQCCIMSVRQPSPDLFALLDMVMVLSRGSAVYFGPPDSALQFFEAAGFRKPAQKSVPDFLEEVSQHPQKVGVKCGASA